MVVDSDDYVGIPTESEKEPVAIINPDHLDNDADQLQDLPLATDRTFRSPHSPYTSSFRLMQSPDEAMKELILPPLAEEPRVLEDVVNTWEIESWRSLSKREHGPIFQAAGFPWYAKGRKSNMDRDSR